jgi:hypothetical protein
MTEPTYINIAGEKKYFSTQRSVFPGTILSWSFHFDAALRWGYGTKRRLRRICFKRFDLDM